MMFTADGVARILKAGRWPSGAPGSKGGQFAPKSVVGGGGFSKPPPSTGGLFSSKPTQTITAPQYGIGLNPASKAEQEAGPGGLADVNGPKGSTLPQGMGSILAKPKGSPHPNKKPGDPDVPVQYPSKPSGPETWHDASAVATFTPGSKAPDALNGVAMKPWKAPTTLEGWAKVSGQNKALDDLPPLEGVEGKTIGAGVIIQEPDGRIWLTKPTNHFGGYQQTFPKGTVEGGLNLQASAIKEAWEETGLKVKLVGHVGDVERDTSVARYFLAERVGGTPADMGWESQALRLTPPDKLDTFLNRSKDLEIAEAIKLEFGVPTRLKKAGAKAGTHHSQGQARWPAGTPLGGQWMAMGADGVVMPPTIAGGLQGKNAAYQAKANAAHKIAQAGDVPALAQLIGQLTDKLTANNAKVKAGGAKTSHMKWTEQLHQYVAQLLIDGAAKPKAVAAATVIAGPAKLSSWGAQVAPKPGGSNPGAIYKNPEDGGALWLVKGNNAKAKTGAAVSDARARSEVLTAKLVALTGAGSVEMRLVDMGNAWGGGLGVATKMLDKGSFQGLDPSNPAHMAAARADFATHAWLANYDALGAGYDNTVIANGKAVCIDPGGGLNFRAQGMPKDPPIGPDAKEWESMRKGSSQQSTVYGSMSAAQLQESAKKVAAITDDQIKAVVESVLSGTEADKMTALLKARRDSIATKAGLTAKPVFTAPPAGKTTTPTVKVATPAPTPPVPPIPNAAAPGKGGYLVIGGPALATPLPGMIKSPTAYSPANTLFSDQFIMSVLSKPGVGTVAENMLATLQSKFEAFTGTLDASNNIKDGKAFQDMANSLSMAVDSINQWKASSPTASSFDQMALTQATGALTAWVEGKIKAHNTAILKAASAPRATPAPAPAPAPAPKPLLPPAVQPGMIDAAYNLAGFPSQMIKNEMDSAIAAGNAEHLKKFAPFTDDGKQNYGGEQGLVAYWNYAVKKWGQTYGVALYSSASSKTPAAKPQPAPAAAVVPAPPEPAWPMPALPKQLSAPLLKGFNDLTDAMIVLAKDGKIDELNNFNNTQSGGYKFWTSVSPAGKAMTAFHIKLIQAATEFAAAKGAAVASGAATITAPGGSPHRVVKGVLTPTAPPPQPAPAMPIWDNYKTKSPANAASHNAKIDKIAALAAKGDTAGLLAMKFGSNTYGKQQQKAANAALAAMGSVHKVVQNQPAASHPAIVPSAVPSTSAAAGPPPVTAVPKPGVPKAPAEGPEAAAKLATRMPKPVDFANFNGSGKGLSSQPWKNAANNSAIAAIVAAAKIGTVAALEQAQFAEVDGSGNPTGKMLPMNQHPSKHVQAYHADVISELKDILNPAPPLAMHNVVDAKSVADISAAFKGKPFGTKASSLPKSEQFGFWVSLGKTARSVAGLKPAAPKNLPASMVSNAASTYQKYSQLTQWFVKATQANSSMANSIRDGKTTYGGQDLKAAVAAVHADATEMPEGTKLTRWQNMDSGMLKQLAAAPDGMVIQATGQMSTSYDHTATSGFGKHEISVYTAPGAKALLSFGSGGFPGEKEVTTLPGARFVLLGKSKKPNGNYHVELLLLPPEK